MIPDDLIPAARAVAKGAAAISAAISVRAIVKRMPTTARDTIGVMPEPTNDLRNKKNELEQKTSRRDNQIRDRYRTYRHRDGSSPARGSRFLESTPGTET